MITPAPVQRRTEDDLRAALAKLERLSPAAHEVLSALRDAGPPTTGRRSWARWQSVPGQGGRAHRAGRRLLAGWRLRPGRAHGAARRSRAGGAHRLGGVPWGAPRPWLAAGAAAAAATAAGLTLALVPGAVPAPAGSVPGGRSPGGAVSGAAGRGVPEVARAFAAQQLGTRQLPSVYQHHPLTSPLRAAATPGDSAAAGLPSAAAVGRAMLAASSSVGKYVLYTTEADLTGGYIQQVSNAWAWPLQPTAGQRAQWRQASTQRAGTGGPLKPAEETGLTYTAPPAGAAGADGRLTLVCYAGTGLPGCEYGATGTPAGTWSVSDGQFLNPGPGPGGLSLAALGHDVVTGLWTVAGRTQANGEQIIVLAETQAGSYQPMPTKMWVDAGTFLPQQILWSTGRDVAQVAWRYLPPTPAALAQLRVKVPPGYRQFSPASQ